MTMPMTAISFDEYKARTRRIQAELDARKCDAFFVTSEDNVQYLTGFRSPVWNNLTRPRYLIVPRKGDPFLVSTANYIIIAQETTWITDVRTWIAPNPEDDGVSLVIEGLKSCLSADKRVAAELGTQSRLTMPAGDFLRIREALSNVEFVDGHDMMMKHRMVKSPGEIARIKHAAKATSEAFQQVQDFAQVGKSLYQITQDLKTRILTHGAEDVPYVVAVAGHGGYPCVNLAPDNKPLKPGDVFVIDVAARFEGYYCDFDRDFIVGEPDEEIRSNYRRVWEATESGIAAVKPGIRMRDIWRAMAGVLGEDTVRSTGIGRMGHSVGLRMCEEPSISQSDHTIVEENMVLTLEPGFVVRQAGKNERERRIVVHEENVVVTSNGAELITVRAPRDIPMVSA